jgi:hypothetical protein
MVGGLPYTTQALAVTFLDEHELVHRDIAASSKPGSLAFLTCNAAILG